MSTRCKTALAQVQHAIEQAKTSLKQGQALEALQALSPLHQQFPEDTVLEMMLAKSYLAASQSAQAEKHLERVLAHPAPPEESFILLARLHQQHKRWSQAQEVLEKALTIHPLFAQAWYELGRTQIEINQPQRALKSLKKAQELSPRQASILSVMGRAQHDLFALEEAVSCYEQALNIHNDHAGLWCDLGNIWRHLENSDKAYQCYQQALVCNPQNRSAQINLSILQLLQNQPQGWDFFKQLRLEKQQVYPQPSQYWDGVIRPHHPLALIEEYGRGDFIQMLRFVPRLLAAGQPACCVCNMREAGNA